MKNAVIDASVVLEWYLGKDEAVAEAKVVMSILLEKKISLIAPTFLLIELSNVLLKKRKVTEAKFIDSIEFLLDFSINFLPFETSQTYDLGECISKYGFSAYDSLYILLAQQQDLPLITLDRELLKHPNSITPKTFLEKYQA